jgi:hypothetical protein
MYRLDGNEGDGKLTYCKHGKYKGKPCVFYIYLYEHEEEEEDEDEDPKGMYTYWYISIRSMSFGMQDIDFYSSVTYHVPAYDEGTYHLPPCSEWIVGKPHNGVEPPPNLLYLDQTDTAAD